MSYIQKKSASVNETFRHGSVALVILGLLSGFPRLHSDTPYSLGYLSSRDRPVPGISTWQHTTFTRHISMSRRDSNIQTQPATGRGPTPQTAWPLGSRRAIRSMCCTVVKYEENVLLELTIYYPLTDYPFAYYPCTIVSRQWLNTKVDNNVI
jgi:hypothetical protein